MYMCTQPAYCLQTRYLWLSSRAFILGRAMTTHANPEKELHALLGSTNVY